MNHLQRAWRAVDRQQGCHRLPVDQQRAASIRDATAFQNYVIENRAWDMLDWKANVTAVGDFITENEHMHRPVSC